MERVRERDKGRECMAIGRSPQDLDNERKRERVGEEQRCCGLCETTILYLLFFFFQVIFF